MHRFFGHKNVPQNRSKDLCVRGKDRLGLEIPGINPKYTHFSYKNPNERVALRVFLKFNQYRPKSLFAM